MKNICRIILKIVSPIINLLIALICLTIVIMLVSNKANAASKPCTDIIIESGMLQTSAVSFGLKSAPEVVAELVSNATSFCESAKNAGIAGVPKDKVIEIADRNTKGFPDDMRKATFNIALTAWADGVKDGK